MGLGRAWNAAYHAEADRRLTECWRQRRDALAAAGHRTVDEEHEFRILTWAPDFADRTCALEHAARLAAVPFAINFECNAALNAETKTWDEHELMSRCSQLDIPAVVVHGALDPRPPWAVDSLVMSLPRCTVAVLDGALQ